MEWLFPLEAACDDGGGPLGRGAGLTRLKSGLWIAFVGICRPVPRSREERVSAGSGCDLIGALLPSTVSVLSTASSGTLRQE